jgi:chromosome segregation ATPase
VWEHILGEKPEPEETDQGSGLEQWTSDYDIMWNTQINEITSIESKIEEVRSEWEQLNRDARTWRTLPENLLPENEGRKVGANEGLMKRFLALRDRKRPSAKEVETLEKRLKEFETAAKSLSINEPLNGEFKSQVEELFEEIHSARRRFLDDLAELGKLRVAASNTVGECESFDEAIKKARQAARGRSIDGVVAEYRRASEETELGQTEEVTSNVWGEAGDELESRRDKVAELSREKERLEQRATEVAAEREEAARKAELESRFALAYPEMEKYLVPFTSHAYTQVIGGSFRTITKEGPVSYRRLVQAGLLNEGIESVNALHSVVSQSGRELGAFPPYSYSGAAARERHETMVRIHAFLREFGPLMVEQKKLAP